MIFVRNADCKRGAQQTIAELYGATKKVHQIVSASPIKKAGSTTDNSHFKIASNKVQFKVYFVECLSSSVMKMKMQDDVTVF